MHEMSIALGIVKIAEEEVVKHEAKYISEIVLEIGELSGIELDSVEPNRCMKSGAVLR